MAPVAGIRDVCPQVDASEQPAQLAGEATAGDVNHAVKLDLGLPVQPPSMSTTAAV